MIVLLEVLWKSGVLLGAALCVDAVLREKSADMRRCGYYTVDGVTDTDLETKTVPPRVLFKVDPEYTEQAPLVRLRVSQ